MLTQADIRKSIQDFQRWQQAATQIQQALPGAVETDQELIQASLDININRAIDTGKPRVTDLESSKFMTESKYESDPGAFGKDYPLLWNQVQTDYVMLSLQVTLLSNFIPPCLRILEITVP